MLRVIPTPAHEAELTCRFALHLLEVVRSECLGDASRAIIDPACGEGHMLLAMARMLRDRDGRHIGGQRHKLHGVDVQREVLARCRSALAGPAGAACETRLHYGDALVQDWEGLAPPGGYDCVIGNPPYVRHEAIRDPCARLTPQAYKAAVRASLEDRFPGLRLGGRADLALLFTLLGLSLLAPMGVLAFVLPGSIFDARYGRALSEALEATGRQGVFLESETRRSFREASINTGILLAGPMTEGMGPLRRHRIDGPLGAVDIRELWSSGETSRSRPLFQRPARQAGDARVPETPLSHLGTVRYPIKTGLNRFFYVTPHAIDRFGIEDEFLLPVLKSPRDTPCIRYGASAARVRLFRCRQTEEELWGQGKVGALAYVRWGGRQTDAHGSPWREVCSLRGRKPWYAIALPPSAHIVCPRFFDRRYLFLVPEEGIVEDQTCYGLILHDPAQRDLISGVLNSSLTHLALEQHGRSGLGDGVRQYALCDMAALPVPDPRAIDERFVPAILEAYEEVSRRPLRAVPEEYGLSDRVALDDAVGAAFGLDHDYMAAVRERVVDRMSRRMERARSVNA